MSAHRLSLRCSLIILFLAVYALPLLSHAVNYEVQQKGIAVRIFYSAKDPASYSEFELYGPGDTLPHQTGRTDKNGMVAIAPDRPGIWKLKVLGESAHGFHGVTIDIKVDSALNLESFSKPLIATSTKMVTGISLIFGIFGILAFIKSRKK